MVADVHLKADARGWTWRSDQSEPNSDRITTLASPKMMAYLSGNLRLSMESPLPVEYFLRRDDGLFELKKLDESTGISFDFTIDKGENDRILLRNFTLTIKTVEKRKPIEGVTLDVGEPIINAQTFTIEAALKDGEDYGIMIPTQGIGTLLMKISVAYRP